MCTEETKAEPGTPATSSVPNLITPSIIWTWPNSGPVTAVAPFETAGHMTVWDPDSFSARNNPDTQWQKIWHKNILMS